MIVQRRLISSNISRQLAGTKLFNCLVTDKVLARVERDRESDYVTSQDIACVVEFRNHLRPFEKKFLNFKYVSK